MKAPAKNFLDAQNARRPLQYNRMRTVSRFPKNAKTEAVLTKGIADRLASINPTELLH
jgi:hypothetical protein